MGFRYVPVAPRVMLEWLDGSSLEHPRSSQLVSPGTAVGESNAKVRSTCAAMGSAMQASSDIKNTDVEQRDSMIRNLLVNMEDRLKRMK
jgi:hypothetical protein